MAYQFIFGGNTGETPESIKRKREIAETLMGRRSFQPVRSVPEGIGSALTSIGNGLAARFANNSANEAEVAGLASANADFAPLAGGFSGGFDALGSGSTAPADVPASYTSDQSTIPTSYFDAARASESGGNPNAKNPRSSASGLYQFTTGTWADVAKRHPELGLTPDGRSDPQQQEKAMRAFTADNANVLRAKGVPVTGGSLYAAHFLGAGAAPSVWNAPDGAPVSSFVDPGVITANPFLRGMTAADFRAWASQKGGGDAPVQLADASPAANERVVQASPEAALATPPGSPLPNPGLTPSQMANTTPGMESAPGIAAAPTPLTPVGQDDLQTAQPVSGNMTVPMPLARPQMAPPMPQPAAPRVHSNQVQSAGDFARAQALAIASGNPTAPIPANGPQTAAPRLPAWMPFNRAPATPAPVSAAPLASPAPVVPQGSAQAPGQIPMDALIKAASNPFLNDTQKAVVQAMIKQRLDQQDPSHQLDIDYKRAQIARLNSNTPSANSSFGSLDAQARAAGLVPGTPQYQEFMLNGGGAPATFRALDMQAKAAGFQPGTPEYNEFMATRGAGLSAGAAQSAKNQADIATGGDAAFAKSSGQAAGKVQGDLRGTLPTDMFTASQTIAQVDQLINAPGLDQIVGPLDQYRGAVTMNAEGRDALARYKQVVGNTFLDAYAMLKGGGQITEVEGAKAQDAKARMDRAQDLNTFKQALRDFRDAVSEGAKKRLQAAGIPEDQWNKYLTPQAPVGGWQDAGNGVKIRVKP